MVEESPVAVEELHNFGHLIIRFPTKQNGEKYDQSGDS